MALDRRRLGCLPHPIAFAARPTDPGPAATSPSSGNYTRQYRLADYATTIHLTGPTTSFHDSVAARYNYAFGKDTPFLPSNAMTRPTASSSAPRAFYTAEYCGHCHKEAYHQWRQIGSFQQLSRARGISRTSTSLIDEKGVQFSRHCEGCHNPVALFSGDLSQGMPKKRPFEEEGVTCSTCHSIQSTDTTGTGSYVMGTPAVLVDENGAPITGPVSDAEILAHLDRHSKAVMRPLYKTAEFCAACHKAAIPAQLDDYKWLRAFSVYDEWQGASFTKQSPLPFYRKDSVSTCQTCHMPREALPGACRRSGRQRRQAGISHRWLGGNTLIPAYYKYDEQARSSSTFLKNGSDGKGVLNVDIFALENDAATETATADRSSAANQKLIAPLGLTSFFNVTPGETLIADVVIQNKGIAHSFIPEQRDFYESWVDFTVKDGSGKILAESGFIQPDGNLDPSAHSFTNRLVNIKGELNDLHQIWHNRVLAYNNTIQSGRSQLVRYRFRLPKAHSGGQFTITATVRYRRFNQHFIDYAHGPGSDKHYPDAHHRHGHRKRARSPSAPTPPRLPAPSENPEWMRWNNYGIALLDAQQYEASVEAFEHVAAAAPRLRRRLHQHGHR